MRLIRISLATKYRILFGMAVLLIIGAALSVPWYLVRELVADQPFREAQRVADDFFRLVMSGPTSGGGSGGVHGNVSAVLPEEVLKHDARFVRFTLRPDDPSSALNQAREDPFIAEALRALIKRPKRDFYRSISREEGGVSYQYAHAVRITKQCLDCHDEGKTARPYREGELAGIVAVSLPVGLAENTLLWNRVFIIAAGILAGILAILVFYIITKRFILSPIHDLREVTIRVAAGDLTVRSTTRTGDEFEQLSDNLNTMLERLRESQEELKAANLLLDQKLGEMAETNVALYESNRVKSEFLANVSHELRTPLTSIIGFAELLREAPRSDGAPRATRYAENILTSGRMLLEMINDLLDLAKIEAGKIQLQIETVHPDELAQSLLVFMRPPADEKQIRLTLESDDPLPALFTDRSRLRQVLFNLLSNAIKFTPDKGSVRLDVQRIGEGLVRIAVTDTGPGISLEDQELIFDKFRQIDQSATREHHGTGLGLAIAKELTQLLGGEIGMSSRPGHGATFWVKLPTTAPEPRDRPLIALV